MVLEWDIVVICPHKKTNLNSLVLLTSIIMKLNLQEVKNIVSYILKVTFMQYPAVHTNYIISHCTTLQYNHNYLTRYLGRKEMLNTKNN